jgi:hypothetical protein
MKRSKGGGSVMAAHAPAEVANDTPQRRLQRQLQFFPTPPWAARAGGELIAALDPEPGFAWEPACGQGHMVHGLKDYFAGVRRTDIHDHGWDGLDRVQDFLAVERDAQTKVDWVVTNPPFAQAADFVRLGLERSRRGVALLCRLSFYEAAARYPLFHGATPLTVLAPFFERVPMELGGWDPRGSTATAYAWFVWVHPAVAAAAPRGSILRAGFEAQLPFVSPIRPGARHRLTRPDDARLFARALDLPLLDAKP